MAQAFDAYQAWLGISPAESAGGGPNHYRLLGLLVFESNPVVVANAADRAAAQVQGFQSGPYKLVAQRVLGEIAAARTCLTDPARKSAYDRELQARLSGRSAAAATPAAHATPMQPLQPIVVQVPVSAPAPLPQVATLAQAPRPATPASPAQPIGNNVSAAAATASPPQKAKSAGFSIPQPVKIVLGGAAGLLLGYFLVYFITGRDLLGVLPARTLRRPTQVAETKQPASTRLGGNNVPSTTPPSSYVPPNRANSPPFGTAFPSETPTEPVTPSTPVNSISNGPTPSTPSEPTPAEPFPPSYPNPTPPAFNPQSNPQLNPIPNPSTIRPPNTAPLPGTTPETLTPETPAPKVKHPTPAPDAQKAMLAELQSLYQVEFDRGNKPDGRQAFVGFLLKTARTLKSDPVAQFVLCREAYDRAMRLEDFITAADVVDELERSFDVDGFRFRMHLLTESARAAKTPDERAPLILFAFDLADYALAKQQSDDVAKLANIAESLARTLPSKDIKAQTTARCAELRKSVEELAPVTAARTKLQADPTDVAASLVVGRHLCLAEGNWPEGLKLLAQSDHPALGAAAKLDLETKADDQPAAVAIGDAWFELAEADPALAAAFARAKHWYERAKSGADGLQKVKLDRRIEQVAAMNLPQPAANKPAAPQLASARFMLTRLKAFETAHVIAAMTPQTIRTQGWYIYTDMVRVDNDAQWARLQSPIYPTGEYQVVLRVRRYTTTPNAGMFAIGLPSGRSQFAVVIDYPVAGKGFASFLTLNGLKKPDDNPTLKVTENLVPRIGTGEQHIIHCSVKRDEISVLLDGQELIQYKGDMSKLTLSKEWAVPDARCMFLGSHQGGFYVHGWVVSPLFADDGTPLPLIKDPIDVGRPGFPGRP